MVDLFKDMLRADESLFLNPQFLDIDFTPPIIRFRENEQKYIAECIKPMLSRRNGKNLLIKGSPGIGKTLATTHVISELKAETNDIFCVYVNCWKKESSFKVLNEICMQVGYKWIHNKSFDVLMRDVSQIINEKSLVLVLDEIDKLSDNSILYSVLEDIFRKTVIMITNNNNFLAALEPRIKSRLLPEILEFRPYSLSETEQIIKERAEYAFVKGVFDEECFDIIIAKAFGMKDLRVGLFLLKESGEIAESKSSRKIIKEHSIEAMERLSLSNVIPSIENDPEFIELIKNNSGRTTSEIFKEYEIKSGKSYRTFQRKIKDLEKINLVVLKEFNKGREGRSTVVEFNQRSLEDY
ncbi:MAG TPA: AAA family ATPase [Candidatus Nanoarchaeia archaeon]|nr:AAA family ATPase [Candidatus Nanoarchaeia archaeon]